MSITKSLTALLTASAVLAAPNLVQAFDIFTEDLSAFDKKIQDNTGFEAFFGNTVIPPVTPFGTGNALRMYDFANFEKPELQGETGPIGTPFRIDFQSFNVSSNTTSKAIRYRMANAGKSISSESRSAFSLSWQADGKFTAKYSDGGLNDGNATDVDTKSILLNFGQVYDITMVANSQTSGNWGYNYFGVDRDLAPQHYDIYVDGVLLNSGGDAWFIHGMKYTLEKSAADYNPALGLSRFGLIGSSDSDVDPDVYFDNVILSIVPEPSSAGLLLIGFLALGRSLVRRRA